MFLPENISARLSHAVNDLSALLLKGFIPVLYKLKHGNALDLFFIPCIRRKIGHGAVGCRFVSGLCKICLHISVNLPDDLFQTFLVLQFALKQDLFHEFKCLFCIFIKTLCPDDKITFYTFSTGRQNVHRRHHASGLNTDFISKLKVAVLLRFGILLT